MKLTWKEVYSRAKVNPSTSAWQRDRFISYFNYIGEGRHRKYSEESIEILSIISSMYQEGKTFDDITEVLENRYGVPIPGELEVKETAVQQKDILDEVRNIFKEEIRVLEEKVDALSRGSEERDKLLMENIGLLMENKKKWWRFWG